MSRCRTFRGLFVLSLEVLCTSRQNWPAARWAFWMSWSCQANTYRYYAVYGPTVPGDNTALTYGERQHDCARALKEKEKKSNHVIVCALVIRERRRPTHAEAAALVRHDPEERLPSQTRKGHLTVRNVPRANPVRADGHSRPALSAGGREDRAISRWRERSPTAGSGAW